MPQLPDPAVARTLLRRELRSLRQSRAVTRSEVARSLHWSISKMDRIEGGQVAIVAPDLRALLNLYGANEPGVREKLLKLSRESRRQQTWSRYRDLFEPEYVRYLGIEGSATTLFEHSPHSVPSMLRTAAYARGLAETRSGLTREKIDRHVEWTQLRHERPFDEVQLTKMTFVFGEGAIRSLAGRPGCREILHDLLEHLVKVDRSERVSVWIAPLAAGLLPAVQPPFSLLGMADTGETVLYLPDARPALHVGDVMKIERHLSVSEEILVHAMPIADMDKSWFRRRPFVVPLSTVRAVCAGTDLTD